MAARLSALCVRRTLPPGFFIFKDSWYSFLLEAESTPGPVRPEELGQFKKPPHRDLNPWPSGLQHSALTTTLPCAPNRSCSSHNFAPQMTLTFDIQVPSSSFAIRVEKLGHSQCEDRGLLTHAMLEGWLSWVWTEHHVKTAKITDVSAMTLSKGT
jgi:hypothetical protein